MVVVLVEVAELTVVVVALLVAAEEVAVVFVETAELAVTFELVVVVVVAALVTWPALVAAFALGTLDEPFVCKATMFVGKMLFAELSLVAALLSTLFALVVATEFTELVATFAEELTEPLTALTLVVTDAWELAAGAWLATDELALTGVRVTDLAAEVGIYKESPA